MWCASMVSAKHGYKKTKLLIQEVEDDDSEEDSEEVYFVVRSKVRGVSESTNSVRFKVQLFYGAFVLVVYPPPLMNY